jgi:hypothetical protein
MQDDLEYAVLAFLQPSEDFKVILEAKIPESEHGHLETDTRRLVVVVTHRDPVDRNEEGR